MLRTQLRLKLVLLLLLSLSTVGMNLFTNDASAACQSCAMIRDSLGHVVGYGCIYTNPGYKFCTAVSWSCTTSDFCYY